MQLTERKKILIPRRFEPRSHTWYKDECATSWTMVDYSSSSYNLYCKSILKRHAHARYTHTHFPVFLRVETSLRLATLLCSFLMWHHRRLEWNGRGHGRRRHRRGRGGERRGSIAIARGEENNGLDISWSKVTSHYILNIQYSTIIIYSVYVQSTWPVVFISHSYFICYCFVCCSFVYEIWVPVH